MPSPIHHASLVDPSTHSPALLELIHIDLSKPVIDYVVDTVADTVYYAMGRPSSSSSSTTAATKNSFNTFVANIIHRAEVTTPVILATLVYVDRAKPHLHIALEQWALERVFLGALITASKYLNDSTLKNVHWALCTGVFGKRDIGRIEREFLDVLDFQLGIAEDDLLSHHHALAAISLASRTPPPHQHQHHYPAPRLLHTRAPPSLPPRRRENNVPGLSPSSSQHSSSSGVSSPRTPPITLASPPHTTSKHKPLHMQMSTLDLLRSFPVPASCTSPPPPSSQTRRSRNPFVASAPDYPHRHHSVIVPPPMQLCV